LNDEANEWNALLATVINRQYRNRRCTCSSALFLASASDRISYLVPTGWSIS